MAGRRCAIRTLLRLESNGLCGRRPGFKVQEISVLLQSSAISVRYQAIFTRQQPGFRCRQNLDNQSQQILLSHLKHNAVRDKEDLSNSSKRLVFRRSAFPGLPNTLRQRKQLFTSHPKVLGSLHKPISPLVPMIIFLQNVNPNV